MESFRPKNRAIEAVNRVAFWVLILTLVCLWLLVNLPRIKSNYTDLHGRVHALEYMHKKGHGH